ncbi:MAG: hypothetical protein AAB532_01910 [Patescibacteria group bacterium]
MKRHTKCKGDMIKWRITGVIPCDFIPEAKEQAGYCFDCGKDIIEIYPAKGKPYILIID